MHGKPQSYAASIDSDLRAAEDVNAIYLPAVEYNIGTLTINGTVILRGEGSDATVLNGKIQYAASGTATEGETISIE